ncbi:MAG TPA: hypothetical protein VFU21_21770 [Kofleriaceae bacterium]|nr:hypothetical protein [Kofleriaceae bacterium]
MARMPRKVQGLDHLPDGLVEEVEAAVRAAGAVPLGKLTRQKLGRRAQAQLFEGLARRGLERTGRAVRVPLREQVVAALADGPVATSALRKRVRGAASAGELKLVVGDLARAGRAAIVVRGGVEEVVAPSDQVLSAAELAAVGRLARDLGKAAAAVRGRAGRPARSLWRAELMGLLDRARAALGGTADAVTLVLDAVRRHASPTTGLAPVPAIARALGPRLPDVRQALLAAAAAGVVELRPESGVGLLAPADADLCPRGPDGWPLSWARALERGGA